MIKAVFFDLDGTLLPMDQDDFIRAYFGQLARKLAPLGYDPAVLPGSIMAGTYAMVANDGRCTNEEAFWTDFAAREGERALRDRPVIDGFYREEFGRVREVCGFAPEAGALVAELRSRGVTCVLATNPIFPRTATLARIDWAGLRAEDFAWITTYETCRFCKPNPRYYEMLLEETGLMPGECIMVGNDVEEDMIPTEALGMTTFLLTDCLINKKDRDITGRPHGGFGELRQFLQENVLRERG